MFWQIVDNRDGNLSNSVFDNTLCGLNIFLLKFISFMMFYFNLNNDGRVAISNIIRVHCMIDDIVWDI